MSPPTRPWRVTVVEWHVHVAVIEAPSHDAAFEEARRILADNPDAVFRFSHCGLESISVEGM